MALASSFLRRLPLGARGVAAAMGRRQAAAVGGPVLRRAMLSTATAAASANPFPSLIISAKGVTARWVCGSGRVGCVWVIVGVDWSG